ncbi:hypothetical protein E2C01_076185 [Portunus trituberculatus]|uniref:Uncharacterized protein n=1 Tax=Portunus trituberculatus TaxID=210409 RepID=A0A5B7I815_PORTR|nr:hypothetical protein [Portunus trituberculatus]
MATTHRLIAKVLNFAREVGIGAQLCLDVGGRGGVEIWNLSGGGVDQLVLTAMSTHVPSSLMPSASPLPSCSCRGWRKPL